MWHHQLYISQHTLHVWRVSPRPASILVIDVPLHLHLHSLERNMELEHGLMEDHVPLQTEGAIHF